MSKRQREGRNQARTKGAPKQSNNHKAHGEVIEQQFTWEGMRRGLTIAKPEGDSAQYDRIVDRGANYPTDDLPRLVTVQVRAVSSKRKDRRGYTVETRVKTDKHRRPLTPEDADILAAYVEPCNAWYFIPLREFAPAQSISLYPHLSRVPKTKATDGALEKWRNRWDVFGIASCFTEYRR
jgi:hypothetical protein